MLMSFYFMFATPEGMAMMGMSWGDSDMSASNQKNLIEKHCDEMPSMNGCENYISKTLQQSGVKNTEKMTHTMGSMSMDDMAKMLEWKTGKDLDRAFLEAMIPHHQGAIDMARYLTQAQHGELQKMGEEIISTQQKEIDQMRAWQLQWGYIET
jgi:uncharacterized protein (DUF305 family)